MEKRVRVVIPVYNASMYLERCILGLINQTYKNIELIFINDGSSDNSLEILYKYKKKDKRIIVIDKENTGASDSRNIGIERCSGDYICFCDSDDVYANNYIEVMYKAMMKHKVSVVKCNYSVYDKDDKLISKSDISDISNRLYDNEKIKKEIIPKCLAGEIPCFSYLLMIDRNALNVKYPTDIAMMEDVVFYIRLLLDTSSFYVIDDCLYKITFNEQGVTNNYHNYKRNILNVIDVNDYIKSELDKFGLSTEENCQKLNINHLNAISDFIYKYYLYGDSDIIDFCRDIRTDKLVDIIKNTDLSKINLQRKLLLRLLLKKKYVIFRIYCFSRNLIRKVAR